MTLRFALPAMAALLTAACHAYPQDPANTLKDIRARGTIRVAAHAMPPEAQGLVHRLEAATGARARIVDGQMEPMLQALEAGKLDLVLAPFSQDTPWKATVALSPALRTQGRTPETLEWRAAMRGGENRWIILVETQARQIGGEGNLP